MANTNKTKAEILQELESIKGLLLEEDHIPILQDMESRLDAQLERFSDAQTDDDHIEPPVLTNRHESVLPGQGSLFDESSSPIAKIVDQLNIKPVAPAAAAAPNTPNPYRVPTQPQSQPQPQPLTTENRPLAKASGENPFLPQHIRERLHGNNPPPLFEYETAKKIINSTKNIAHKTNKPRQYLVEEVMLSIMPQLERELRQRLFAMSVEDLEKLLNEDED
ncbi:hypothetical protein [Cellvibrio sp. NN19]|uniref:hypothetical protein n=1 Tax=Cellvibrio chitinivorans TaxID=3102792 RepID=UPI002B401707|nr:hypothetical protein [Cellvibrio sp. NN19]